MSHCTTFKSEGFALIFGISKTKVFKSKCVPGRRLGDLHMSLSADVFGRLSEEENLHFPYQCQFL